MKITINEPIPAVLADAIDEARAAVREWRREHGDAGSTNAQVAAAAGLMPVEESPVASIYTGGTPHHTGRSFAYSTMHDPALELMVQALMQGTADITAEDVWVCGIDDTDDHDRVTFDGGATWHAIPAHVEVECAGADHTEQTERGLRWHVYGATLRSSIV
jgi:hypothetical protein